MDSIDMNKHFCEYHLTSIARRENKQNEKCYDEGTKRVVNVADAGMTPRLLCEEHYHYVLDEVMRQGNVMATKKKDGTGFKVLYDKRGEEKE